LCRCIRTLSDCDCDCRRKRDREPSRPFQELVLGTWDVRVETTQASANRFRRTLLLSYCIYLYLVEKHGLMFSLSLRRGCYAVPFRGKHVTISAHFQTSLSISGLRDSKKGFPMFFLGGSVLDRLQSSRGFSQIVSMLFITSYCTVYDSSPTHYKTPALPRIFPCCLKPPCNKDVLLVSKSYVTWKLSRDRSSAGPDRSRQTYLLWKRMSCHACRFLAVAPPRTASLSLPAALPTNHLIDQQNGDQDYSHQRRKWLLILWKVCRARRGVDPNFRRECRLKENNG
jgi:hypothetical protein